MPGRDDTLETVLKLNDQLSRPMQQAEGAAVSSMAKIDEVAVRITKDFQRVTQATRSAVPEITAVRRAMATPPPGGPGMSKPLQQVKEQAKEASREVEKLKERIAHSEAWVNGKGGSSNMFGSLVGANLLAGGISRGMSFVKDQIGASIGAAMNFQAQSKSFEVLTGSAERGRQLMDELRHLKQSTIMGASVYKNAQTMMGFGIGNNEVIKDLRQIGDIAMGDQDRMQSLTLAFSQTRAAGRLMGQDLLQYVNAGFNPLKVMSDHWQQFGLKQKKTVGELKDMMEDGKISSAAVSKAFEVATSKGGQFYKMMDQIGETSYGQLQKLKGNFAAFQIDMGNAMTPIANSFMDAANDVLHFLHISETVPDRLINEQVEVNVLIDSITKLNGGNETRARLIDMLKAKYPDMFSNLDREKAKNSELLGILKDVNRSYQDRINLASHELNIQTNNDEINKLQSLMVKATAQYNYFKAHPDETRGLTGGSYRFLSFWDRVRMSSSGVNYKGQNFADQTLKNFADGAQKRINELQGQNFNEEKARDYSKLVQSVDRGDAMLKDKSKQPAWWKHSEENRRYIEKWTGMFRGHEHDENFLQRYRKQFQVLANLTGDNNLNASGAGGNATGAGSGLLSGANSDTSSKITGGGRKQIIINVNREMIAGGITINAKTVEGGLDHMEQKVSEVLLRILNSANAVQD